MPAQLHTAVLHSPIDADPTACSEPGSPGEGHTVQAASSRAATATGSPTPCHECPILSHKLSQAQQALHAAHVHIQELQQAHEAAKCNTAIEAEAAAKMQEKLIAAQKKAAKAAEEAELSMKAKKQLATDLRTANNNIQELCVQLEGSSAEAQKVAQKLKETRRELAEANKRLATSEHAASTHQVCGAADTHQGTRIMHPYACLLIFIWFKPCWLQQHNCNVDSTVSQ